MTLEAWVRFAPGTGSRGIIEEEHGIIRLHVQNARLSAGYLLPTGSSLTIADVVTFPFDRWVHVATTYDGRFLRLYRDGVQVAQVEDVRRQANVGPWRIGNPVGATTLLGQYDDVAFYRRALSASEIVAHAQERDDEGGACDLCPGDSNPSCVPTTCTAADGDGFGVQGATACSGGLDKIDCNDGNAAIHPGASEVADAVDNDCDGVTDGKMVAATVITQVYDANGNQVRKAAADGLTEYVFDARDRLVEVKSAGATVARYGYDTQNLRVYMNDGGGERRVLLDGVEELMELEAGAMSQVSRWDRDPTRVDALLAQVAGSKTHVVTDALGSVYGLTDSSAAIQARYSYDVSGPRTASTETVLTSWGFTGRRADPTGLAYYRQRHLDVNAGGFTQVDPAGIIDGPNKYRYVQNRPTVFADPQGLAAIEYITTPERSCFRFPFQLLTGIYDSNQIERGGFGLISRQESFSAGTLKRGYVGPINPYAIDWHRIEFGRDVQVAGGLKVTCECRDGQGEDASLHGQYKNGVATMYQKSTANFSQTLMHEWIHHWNNMHSNLLINRFRGESVYLLTAETWLTGAIFQVSSRTAFFPIDEAVAVVGAQRAILSQFSGAMFQ